METTNIVWFRRDLRLYDHTALHYAMQQQESILPVFIFDTEILEDLKNKNDARVQFLHNQCVKINETLRQSGGSFHVFHGKPKSIFEKLVNQYNIKAVFTNRDYEPYAIKRDKSIENMLRENGIDFYTFKDQVIFEKEEILTANGEPYKVFTPYKIKWLQKLNQSQLTILPDYSKSTKFLQSTDHILPQMKDIGFGASDIVIPPLNVDTAVISRYHKNRDYPAKPKGTTRLGIHLRHGTLSIRRAVEVASKTNETWLNELIWRDFYMMILSNFPHVTNNAFKPAYDQIPWRNHKEEFELWCKGQTGYPIVDAGMRELNNTGYMHNRVRMIVASFLTKHLLIDWRWGEAYFAEKLLDYELASNNGGWQWAAGTGTDAQPYFRIFNPQSQTEKFDKELIYIRKWIPEIEKGKYPKPIVEHKFARQRAINTYKQALS